MTAISKVISPWRELRPCSMDNDVLCQEAMPGVHPTNGISIEFEILSKFGVLYLKICISYHNKIFHTSLKLHCHDVCKIWL